MHSNRTPSIKGQGSNLPIWSTDLVQFPVACGSRWPLLFWPVFPKVSGAFLYQWKVDVTLQVPFLFDGLGAH